MIREKLNIKPSDFEDIFGQDEAKRQLASALISGRHVIIVGPPGIGKTTLAKNLARLLPEIQVNDCEFNCSPDNPVCPMCKSGGRIKHKVLKPRDRFIRVQGSPDLTAEDLIGDIDPLKALKFSALAPESFSPGKIFKANKGILFFDELNRCPERIQNALLQVLEEGIATIGSYRVDIPTDFIFIGTMNPKDTNTERLSDVLLDRFDLIRMGYPETSEVELRIIAAKGKKLDVEFPKEMLEFIVKFVRRLRDNQKLELLPSVRASLGLYERAQANAILDNKKRVELSHIKEAVFSVIPHRIKLKPSHKYLIPAEELVKEELNKMGDCP